MTKGPVTFCPIGLLADFELSSAINAFKPVISHVWSEAIPIGLVDVAPDCSFCLWRLLTTCLCGIYDLALVPASPRIFEKGLTVRCFSWGSLSPAWVAERMPICFLPLAMMSCNGMLPIFMSRSILSGVRFFVSSKGVLDRKSQSEYLFLRFGSVHVGIKTEMGRGQFEG